jgi:hypothetical protein
MTDFSRTPYHTVIIGAGASGLFCAGSFTAKKLLLDHNAQPAVKVSVSGGGKCNFSNQFMSAACYDSQNKHFCKSALAAFGPQDFIRLLQEEKINFDLRPSGQYFAQNAKDIVRFLVKRAERAHTHLLLATQVLSVSKNANGFLIHTSRGNVQAERVVVATGGLSFRTLGASSFGMQVARTFNLPVVTQRPALCGFMLPQPFRNRCRALAGNSIFARVTLQKRSFEGPLLFTHEGISGPCVLQASLYWQENASLLLNLLPETDVLSFLKTYKNTPAAFSSILKKFRPAKIVKIWLDDLDKDLANATKQDLQQAAEQLNRLCIVPRTPFGYTKAEVTAGGIDTRYVNPVTLESRLVPGLYFTGEVLDVTGQLGGYNLQWAWSSGYGAAKALEKFF